MNNDAYNTTYSGAVCGITMPSIKQGIILCIVKIIGFVFKMIMGVGECYEMFSNRIQKFCR